LEGAGNERSQIAKKSTRIGVARGSPLVHGPGSWFSCVSIPHGIKNPPDLRIPTRDPLPLSKISHTVAPGPTAPRSGVFFLIQATSHLKIYFFIDKVKVSLQKPDRAIRTPLSYPRFPKLNHFPASFSLLVSPSYNKGPLPGTWGIPCSTGERSPAPRTWARLCTLTTLERSSPQQWGLFSGALWQRGRAPSTNHSAYVPWLYSQIPPARQLLRFISPNRAFTAHSARPTVICPTPGNFDVSAYARAIRNRTGQTVILQSSLPPRFSDHSAPHRFCGCGGHDFDQEVCLDTVVTF
jgi:hypothetical protein